MASLQALFPGTLVPEPLETKITRWGQDPYSLGAYSYVSFPWAKEKARQMLATPVHDTLLFAGEATHKGAPSTVHGAYLTGIREAERIIGWKRRAN